MFWHQRSCKLMRTHTGTHTLSLTLAPRGKRFLTTFDQCWSSQNTEQCPGIQQAFNKQLNYLNDIQQQFIYNKQNLCPMIWTPSQENSILCLWLNNINSKKKIREGRAARQPELNTQNLHDRKSSLVSCPLTYTGILQCAHPYTQQNK